MADRYAVVQRKNGLVSLDTGTGETVYYTAPEALELAAMLISIAKDIEHCAEADASYAALTLPAGRVI